MLERDYQAKLIKKIKARFKGARVRKNNANYRQGDPDLTVFIGHLYFDLEVKRSAKAPLRPNQQYYHDLINESGGFARFIYPENEEEIFDEIQRSLSDERNARLPKSE